MKYGVTMIGGKVGDSIAESALGGGIYIKEIDDLEKQISKTKGEKVKIYKGLPPKLIEI